MAATRKAAKTAKAKAWPKKPLPPVAPGQVRLLSGGNPQIPKGDGDAPVQAYLAAIEDWRGEVCRKLDRAIERAVPGVRKAVRWNSPFYGSPKGSGWFMSYHLFTRYVKVSFFRGTSLDPVPPGTSKDPEARYWDIHQDDPFDEKRLASWLKQAAKLPGVMG